MTPIAFNLTPRLKACLPGDARYSTLLALYEALQEAAVFEISQPGSDPVADADGWIPHNAGDPMPCAPDALVDVKLEDGGTDTEPASRFGWDDDAWLTKITHWRPARSGK